MKVVTSLSFAFVMLLALGISGADAWYHPLGSNLWSSHHRHHIPSFLHGVRRAPLWGSYRDLLDLDNLLLKQELLLNALFGGDQSENEEVHHTQRQHPSKCSKPVLPEEQVVRPKLSDSQSKPESPVKPESPQTQTESRKTDDNLMQIAKFLDLFNSNGDLDELVASAPALPKKAEEVSTKSVNSDGVVSPADSKPEASTSVLPPADSKPEAAVSTTSEASAASQFSVPFHSVSLNPVVQFQSNEHEVSLSVSLPGVDSKDLKLELITDSASGIHSLVVSGERKTEQLVQNEQGVMSSSSYSKFSQSFALPRDADVAGISARHKDNVLNVTVPKLASKPSSLRNIPIQVA